jgi:diaminopimelate epimerase
MRIPFFKMSGSGNDFIIIDNRQERIDEDSLADFIESVCRRKMSVGADGLILIEVDERVDFKWRYFNKDGGRAEMCGNGARCAARFACINQIAGETMAFTTDAGIVHAQVKDDQVKIKMTEPAELKLDYMIELENGPISVSSINTGVPHVVVSVEKLSGVDVAAIGRQIRYHKAFHPAGTNANFIEIVGERQIAIRTYERGVEDETLACGTGSVAGALIMAKKAGWVSPVEVLTRSGSRLTVHFSLANERVTDIYLEGDARVIYEGELWPDSWQYAKL